MSVWQRNGFTVIPKIVGGFGTTAQSTVNGLTGVSEINGATVVVDAEVTTWSDAVGAISGTNSRPNTRSTWLAQNLIMALKDTAYNSKIVYLLPMFGQSFAAAQTPLRDALGKGSATNVANAFLAGDFSEATGLQGNGTSKALDSLIKPSELGTSNNGGIGYWENNIAFDGTTVYLFAGCHDVAGTNYYSVGGWSAALKANMNWGLPANGVSDVSTTATNGHFYCERSGATAREIYKNGVSLGTNTTSDAAANANAETMAIVGLKAGSTHAFYFFHGRCAVAYFTDGTMGATNAAAFDTLLRTYLFTPTGRPAS